MNKPEPALAKQAPAKTKARQVANVVAEQESSAAGQGSGNVTLLTVRPGRTKTY